MGLKAQSWWKSTERPGICLDSALIGRCHDHHDVDVDVDVDDPEIIDLQVSEFDYKDIII